MPNQDRPVLEAIAAHWQLPGDPGAPPTHSRNHRISEQEVQKVLARRFSEEETAQHVASFLEEQCQLGEQNRVPNSYERYLCDCCLTLASAPDGLRIPTELVQRVVRALPLPIWYFPVGLLVERYLTVSQLLETLVTGITQPTHPGMLQDCLAGFRMYLGAAQFDPELRSDSPILAQTQQVLGQCTAAADPEVARLATQAKSVLTGYLASLGLAAT